MERTWCTVRVYGFLILILAAGMMILPAAADSGTMTISYRGSGSGYIGDSFIFDGRNTVGNTTVISITGPGLPADGVPLYDLAGTAGTGNTVVPDGRGLWVFSWDTSRIDQSRLQTARYTITVRDRDNEKITASTTLMLKKPEFYLIAQPAAPMRGDYVTLDGMAEKGVTYIKIDITDSSGKVVRTFMAPVSGTGSFQYGFHADMTPGHYSVAGTNPSMKKNLGVTLNIQEPVSNATATPGATQAPGQTVSSAVTPSAPAVTNLPDTPAQHVPTQAGLPPVSAALALAGAILISLFTRSRQP